MKPDRSIYRGRFAPSPSGPLHFGSLVAALGSWLRARAEHGRWLVRIDDIDAPRVRSGAARSILVMLAAHGLEPDEPVIYQSRRRAFHIDALARLREAGAIYACACTRGDLVPFNGTHPPRCIRTPESGRPTSWRVRAPRNPIRFKDHALGPQRQQCDDFVVQRANGTISYQLATVVDDADARVTEVVRGADLLDSTARQILLQRLLRLQRPDYLHLPLALDGSGRKLSKREDALVLDIAAPLPTLGAALAFLGQRV
ncbi:MAG: tRNA glutamyl-Q(34) synthetase GluQRS, partial [Rhodanobacteraceae bacterium]